MLTENYYSYLAVRLLAGASNNKALLRVQTTGGYTGYISSKNGSYDFPNRVNATNFSLNRGAGISVGAGRTTPTKYDHDIEEQITENISGVVTSADIGVSTPGTPYIEFTVTITNTGSESVIIREIGYKEAFYASVYPEFPVSESGGTSNFLLDRTVLTVPIEIQAGESGVILYRIEFTTSVPTQSGVNLASFTYGSEDDIIAMIDAARLGVIDLQTDGGWKVGDVRTIHLNAWTGGNGVEHAAEDIDIVISEFGDYNSCGSLFQFDFAEVLTGDQRMNPTDTNNGGYSVTEMYTTTLPALVDALPNWLKTRLKTFSVLTSEGNGSSTIESIPNNKLALRSATEVYPSGSSHAISGEGQLVSLYNSTVWTSSRRGPGRVNSHGGPLWLRSPYKTNAAGRFVLANHSSLNYAGASNPYGVCPFGCL